MTDSIPIETIQIGKRHRRDLGDVDALARSIGEIGLLQPIVLRPDGMLIAGERRLRAVQKLGWSEIPATVVDLDAVVRGEFAENAERKDFTLSESVAIKRALEPIERIAAQQRMRAGVPSENFSKGRALDKVANVVGRHRTTIEKAEAVVTAAEAEPKKYGRLLQQMDGCGRVNGIYRRLRNMQQAEAMRAEPPPLPMGGPYRVVTCDCPWPYDFRDQDPSHRGARPYPTMTVDAIKAMAPMVQRLLHADVLMWFWTTNFHMRAAYDVLDAWGLEARTILTWAKNRPGNGYWLRDQSEHCLMAIRGKPTVTLTNETTVLHAPRSATHSAKPIEFYDFVEKLCPAPRYLDLFSRYRHNERWDCYGDEAPAMEAAQ